MAETLDHSARLDPHGNAAPQTAALNAAPSIPAADGHHFKTKGEQKFDRLTYNHIGYIANVALSIAAVYWVERTHRGQQFMSGFVEKMKGWLPKANPKTAQWLAARSFYLVGGFAVIPPMKWLENRKIGMVKKYDRQIYGDATDTDPEIIESHQELEAAPKQSWASIISSRLLALLPFYALVGLAWSGKSPLAKITNAEYRGLDQAAKQATLALEDANPSRFSQMMSKGVFFDRPISAVARFFGKGAAKVTGNAEAVARIERMQQNYPGMLKEGAIATERDPNHTALPYYFISEAITSAMVARGVYVLTRLLAPVMGHKTQPAPPAAKPATQATPEVLAKVKEDAANDDRPQTKVDTIQHHATAALAQHEAAR